VDFEGIYEVIIIDACGEVGSLIIEGWFCSTVIPNVFSPNNDNRNDLFVISGLQGFPNSELKIFNRWGGIVYESPNYRNTWNAADVSDGTYYYVLNRSDGKTFNGEVTILRK
ncbi:MAG: gliding motility-associated-like protein, partial [Flavobacteriales bacterium]